MRPAVAHYEATGHNCSTPFASDTCHGIATNRASFNVGTAARVAANPTKSVVLNKAVSYGWFTLLDRNPAVMVGSHYAANNRRIAFGVMDAAAPARSMITLDDTFRDSWFAAETEDASPKTTIRNNGSLPRPSRVFTYQAITDERIAVDTIYPSSTAAASMQICRVAS